MKKKLKDYLPYYIGQEIITPDGVGKLVGLPWSIVGADRVNVHFGILVKTPNSIDGGYNKIRNHGHYAIEETHYIGIKDPVGSPPEFTMPGGTPLLLRSLGDLNREELQEFFTKFYGYELGTVQWKDSSSTWELWSQIGHGITQFHLRIYDEMNRNQFLWLIEKGIDVFYLIKDGLAINKTMYKYAEVRSLGDIT